MSKGKVHKRVYLDDDWALCGIRGTDILMTSGWYKVTCKSCLKKRPKPNPGG